MTRRSPFIEGFREPTLSKNSFLTLADVRGDGQGKLVIWSEQQNNLIVYKGSNRELQKNVKLKNVSGIIQYQDEERNAQAVIGLSAENGFYIFRALSQSFRLKVPDIYAETQQQIIWSQYESNPEQLGEQLLKLNPNTLSETAKYFLGSNTIERKKELIQYVFSDGINEKDSISAMALLRSSDTNFMGNVILGTQLRRLYILDSYGHSIISRRAMPFVPSIILGHGSITSKHVIICIGRQGDICIYMQKDLDQPSEKMSSSARIVSACLSFPDMLIVSADQTLSQLTLSFSNAKILAKKYSIKFGSQPIKVQYLKVKAQKMSIVAFPNEVRFYNQKELNYTFVTDFKLYNVIWGSFAREECCLILLYQNAGFEVLILHRQFNVKQKYGSNKVIQKEFQNIPIPKKTVHFLAYWNDKDIDEAAHYRLLEQGLKLLKWRTLSQKFTEGGSKSRGKIQINSNILGLGPIFKVQIQVQNLSQEVLFDIGLMVNYDRQKLQLSSCQHRIGMLPPFTPTSLQLQLTSLSYKNESVVIQLISASNITSTTVFIPNCEQFSNV